MLLAVLQSYIHHFPYYRHLTFWVCNADGDRIVLAAIGAPLCMFTDKCVHHIYVCVYDCVCIYCKRLDLHVCISLFSTSDKFDVLVSYYFDLHCLTRCTGRSPIAVAIAGNSTLDQVALETDISTILHQPSWHVRYARVGAILYFLNWRGYSQVLGSLQTQSISEDIGFLGAQFHHVPPYMDTDTQPGFQPGIQPAIFTWMVVTQQLAPTGCPFAARFWDSPYLHIFTKLRVRVKNSSSRK